MIEQEQTITTDDGVRLYVRIKGDGDQTVIVPNAIYMENAFDALGSSRRWVHYDLRNRGRSERVTERDRLIGGIDRDVDDLEAVRRCLNIEQAVVIGHSYPAFIAALYAIRHPHRVQRLAMLSPLQPNLSVQYPPHLTNTDAVARDVFTELAKLQTQPATDPVEQCKLAWKILRPLYVADPAHAERLADWGFCELENERTMLRHLNEFILPSIKALTLNASVYAQAFMPTLIVHGNKDRSAPYGGGREWALRLPNARFLKLDDVAHVPWIEAPARTYDALDAFLSDRWPADAVAVNALEP